MKSSRKPGNNALNLEEDLLLSRADMAYMEKARETDNSDLESYINFLMEIGAFDRPEKTDRTFYDAEFELPLHRGNRAGGGRERP